LHRHAATLRCLFDAIYVSNSRLAVDICVSARDAGAPRVVVVRPAICGTTVDRQRRFSCHCRWPDAYARQPVAEPPNSRRGVCCLSVPVRPLHPVMYVALLHVRVRTPRGRVGARARTAGGSRSRGMSEILRLGALPTRAMDAARSLSSRICRVEVR
jgi:hypothetical protein